MYCAHKEMLTLTPDFNCNSQPFKTKLKDELKSDIIYHNKDIMTFTLKYCNCDVIYLLGSAGGRYY